MIHVLGPALFLYVPDHHGVVIRPTDDVLAVRLVRRRVHFVRVPRQRAFLLIARTQHAYTAANERSMSKHDDASLPVAAFHIFTVSSRDALTMCLPSGEYATEVAVRNLNVGSKRSFVGRELLSGQKMRGCLKILAVAAARCDRNPASGNCEAA